MDAHQHRDQAPQDWDAPPGQVQRRPFHIALNIDRHEPQLDRAGPDRGPPNRDRRQRQPELPPQLGQQERLQDVDDVLINEQLLGYSVVTVTVGLSVCAFILLFTVLFFYANLHFEEGFDFYRNMTDTTLKNNFKPVIHLVTLYEIIFGFSIGVRALFFFLYMFKFDLYRYISLGSYATALLLAVCSGHLIYELTKVAALISRYSSAYEYIRFLSLCNLCTIIQRQMVLGCLVEWAIGLALYNSLRDKVYFPCTPTIPAIATLLANVGVFIMYYYLNK